MHNKLIPALIGILIICGAGGLAYWQHTSDSVPTQETQSGDSAQTAYSMEDVAKHASADDCWAIINGGVYDLTSWVSRHPGGERAIESICGKDGSAAFNGQHGGGAQQEAILAELKIGVRK